MSGERQMTSGVRALVGAEVLVIDKDDRVLRGMTQLLASANLHVTTFTDRDLALEQLRRKFFSVAVIDLDTPEPNNGLATIARVREISPTTMIVILTPRRSFGDTVSAIRAGAIDIVLKDPESVQYLKDRVLEAAGRSVGKREVNSILLDVRDAYDDFLRRFMDAEKRALDLEDRASGHDPLAALADEIRVLVVDFSPTLAQKLDESEHTGFRFEYVLSGGEALDRCTSSRYHVVMANETLPDLPGSMVVRSIKTQAPDMIGLLFRPPGPGGRIDLIESTRSVAVLESFTEPAQFIERLDDIADALRAKVRERRYTQGFRERHYDFLRRYVELKLKIDRALG